MTLTASVGNTQNINYLWSTGATTQSINVTPSVQTPYSVTVSNSCYSGSASYTVTPCYSPASGSFPLVTSVSWFYVNWSGNCTGQCNLRILDASSASGTTPAYGATVGTLRVFDRWGEMIFQQVEGPRCGGLWNGIFTWNGIYNGQPVQQGVYPWKLILEDCTHTQALGNARIINGAVTVLGTQ